MLKNPNANQISKIYYKLYAAARWRWGLDKSRVVQLIDKEIAERKTASLKEFVHFYLGVVALIDKRHSGELVQATEDQKIIEEKAWLMGYNPELGVRPLDVMHNAKGVTLMRQYIELVI